MTPAGWRDLLGDAKVIFEVGCNDGTDTAMFLDLFPNATVYCWEPDSRPRARFIRRFDPANNPRVRLHCTALSDHCRPEPWYASKGKLGDERPDLAISAACRDDWDQSGSILRPTGHLDRKRWPWLSFDRSYVMTQTLDSALAWYPQVRVIDLLWIDVQGAEMKVIRGGPAAIERTRFLYLEIHDEALYDGQPTFDEVAAALPDFRFRGWYDNDNALFERTVHAP